MRVQGVARLRMLGSRARAIAISGAKYDRKIALPAKHVSNLACLIDHLVERHERKRHRPPVNHRAVAAARRTDGDTGHGRLRNWHPLDASRSVLREQGGRWRG